MIRCRLLTRVLVAFSGLLIVTSAQAGMPALLPSTWTAETDAAIASTEGMAPYLQGISFFVAVLLGSAWAVKGLWQLVRKDFPGLPPLSYGRSLSLVVLWGLLFVVVLTMISGARELMTPGAWRKQGWTYKLADTTSPTPADSRAERRQALDNLRLALWKYAATHDGRFPAANDEAIDESLWTIPGWPGLRFELIGDRRADDAGRLLVYEPELETDERLVLLTNGMIGTMRSAEIRQALAAARQP